MASRTFQPVPKTYADLRREVAAVLFAGREAIEVAWVRTYHESGRLIHAHLLANQARANYGAKTFARLSADTGVSTRTLHECVQFYRCYLSDIFFTDPTDGGAEIFLNNLLLEHGHAVRKDDFSLEDWDEVKTTVPG